MARQHVARQHVRYFPFAIDARNSALLLVLPIRDTTEVLTRYLQDHRVNVSSVVSIPPAASRALRVSGTPTLILADRTGTVLRVWIRQLPPEREQEVLEAVAPQKGLG